MLFNSIHFILFLPVVVIIYFSLPYRYRWVLLLIASYYFYMAWRPEYVFLIVFSTLVDYFVAIKMSKVDDKQKRKKYLIMSLVINLGLLFLFKYFNFFSDSTRLLLNNFNIFYNLPSFKLLLPVGISFYTFQTLSYTIDVCKGKRKPEKHLGIFALYVSFFPQLVAGPIERSTSLLPQFYKKYDFDYDRVASGLCQMLWGFFKKIVIADNIANLVNLVFSSPENFQGIHFIIATILFAFQIYCDFSGYSDIAIGTARIMGFELMRNFNRPYFAKSISDFWNRWHISLSTWFRDYLYIPLGGNRVNKFRMYLNLMITFVISGLWHGANWTFVVWGFLHGLYLIFEKLIKNVADSIELKFGRGKFLRIYSLFQTFYIFVLVCFAWIFFRADFLSDALYIVSHLFDGVLHFIVNFWNINEIKLILSKFNITPLLFVEIWISILFLLIIQALRGEKDLFIFLRDKKMLFRWSFYYLLIFWILFFGYFGEQPFIYFQF